MIWLGIETANAPLSVALVKDGKVLAEIVQNVKLTHSVGAMPAVEEVFQKAGLVPSDIDAVAVSEGPGSYTGVRIGVKIEKTLAPHGATNALNVSIHPKFAKVTKLGMTSISPGTIIVAINNINSTFFPLNFNCAKAKAAKIVVNNSLAVIHTVTITLFKKYRKNGTA